MSITKLLRDWLQYPCNIHKNLITCLSIKDILQPLTKKPCLSMNIVLEWAGSGKILATHVFNKQTKTCEVLYTLWETYIQLTCKYSAYRTTKFWTSHGGNLLDNNSKKHLETNLIVFMPSNFDPSKLKCLGTLTGHSLVVRSVSWDPSNTKLASGSRDNTLKIWDMHSKKCLGTLTGHSESVNSVSWDPSGTKLASGSYDMTVKLWGIFSYSKKEN